MSEQERRFPIQCSHREPRQRCTKIHTIPWSVAEAAYAVYARKFGTSQSLERLAERAGFGEQELLWLLVGGPDDRSFGGI